MIEILKETSIIEKLQTLRKIKLSKVHFIDLSKILELVKSEEFLEFVSNLEEDEDTNNLIIRCIDSIEIEKLVKVITDKEKMGLVIQVKKYLEEDYRGSGMSFDLYDIVKVVKNFFIHSKDTKVIKHFFLLQDFIYFDSIGFEYSDYISFEREINDKT